MLHGLRRSADGCALSTRDVSKPCPRSKRSRESLEPLVLAVELHPAAVREAERAARWYSEHADEEVAERFVGDLRNVLGVIAATPQRWPSDVATGFRRARLDAFPYVVVDALGARAARVVAVAHTRRKPGFWRRRR